MIKIMNKLRKHFSLILSFQSDYGCDTCSAEYRHEIINAKLAKFEQHIEDTKSNEPEEFEKLLNKMSTIFHENHYWILDVKRRLIDIYGNKDGFELYKLPKVGILYLSDFYDLEPSDHL